MENDRDEMGSDICEGNGVVIVKSRSVAGISLGNLPEWFLSEVLIRLPVKLVFRFKLVSKQWLYLISNPSFVRMYLSRASILPQLHSWTFILGNVHVDGSENWDFPVDKLFVDIHSKDLKSPSLYILPCPSAQQSDEKKYIVLGVSNGLVLYGSCIDHTNYNYSICNPITRQWITLPPHTRDFKVVSRGFVTRVENGVLVSYKVIHLDEPLQRNGMIRFEIFLSEIHEWKDFTIYTDQEIELASLRYPTALDGILHWMTREHGILAYDPYQNTECVRYMALPGHIDVNVNDEGMNRSFCDEHQGQLRYFEIIDVFLPPHGFSGFCVWVLSDYCTGDWCLQHRVSSDDMLFDDFISNRNLDLELICFHPFDSDIVYMGYSDIIVSYNIKTRRLEDHGVLCNVGRSQGNNYKSWWTTFSLVIPTWPMSITPPSFVVTED